MFWGTPEEGQEVSCQENVAHFKGLNKQWFFCRDESSYIIRDNMLLP